MKNYAFIDTQNLIKGASASGFKVDLAKFRKYLLDKYSVKTAYLFIGYLHNNNKEYEYIKKIGYEIILKPVLRTSDNKIKGNCDADLVLQAMIDINNYEQAIIVTSDGDFYSLVNYLYKNNKLKCVISPYEKSCSVLIKESAKEKLNLLSELRDKIMM